MWWNKKKLSSAMSDQEGARPSLILWTTIFAVFIAIFWASQAEIDQITRAQGQVIASSRTQVIQSGDGGTVEDMLVKEGDRVERGQVLVRLDKTKIESLYLEARAKVAALRAAQSRLRAEIFGGEPIFSEDVLGYPQFKQSQLLLLTKKRNAIREQVQAIKGMLTLAKSELAMTEPLLKTGDVSMSDILKLQRTIAELQGQLTNVNNKYLQDTQAEITKVEEDLAGAEQTLAQRRDQLAHIELKSPVNGIVKNVRITTLGGVVKPSEEVMEIVPEDDDLLIEAKVKPTDIAFIRPGLNANVKIDAYDYSIYGSLNGKLTYISADTLTEDLKQGEQAYYRVQVKALNKKFSARPKELLEIQPGMTATVEIITGQSTVLKYIIKPVIKTMSESLSER
ncbi:HlyD family type I secretion periplasmic adaptor subunit [Candidatus Methylopumilus turicensis]|uniref:Membrane fusion protein (MFP) family protein n=1 Tax=Candidatus Methylopumilus turicensis TaxID=1581680 RepID=A0A0B7J0C9_9PROT|nr:HlyD family type I secretion periplasmic adaptor subunit [Candidatus Methylopumilus turicensis]CEN56207.1 Secretion protein [Candidatus Methylopumilus turicensis]